MSLRPRRRRRRHGLLQQQPPHPDPRTLHDGRLSGRTLSSRGARWARLFDVTRARRSVVRCATRHARRQNMTPTLIGMN